MYSDTIIIGSGISGLLCALKLAEEGKTSGKKVTIITKKKLSDGSTKMAQGGMAGVQDTQHDSFDEHIQDTLIAGDFHNKKSMVSTVVRRAPEALQALRELGVKFDTTLHLEGGHSHPRIAHYQDTTGKMIEEALVRQARKNKNITIIEHAHAIDLIMKHGKCTGVYFLYKKSIQDSYVDHVILATGGVGQVYAHTTNPKVATGDGIAMAYRAGAELEDMEFVQFHPTALGNRGNPHFLLSEALRGAGAQLIHADGKTFMQKYDPRGDLSPRDIVTKAIYQEEQKGSVFLQFRVSKNVTLEKQNSIREAFPSIYATVKKILKKDLATDLIPVTPVAHYLCGGIKVDQHGQTSVPHLYAIGECAGTGLHGANRLASNSLLEGAATALLTAKYIITTSHGYSQKMNKKIIQKNSPHDSGQYSIPSQPYKLTTLRTKIRQIMWNYVGIKRSKNGLEKAKFELERMYDLLPPRNLVNTEILETRNMLDVSIQITKAALARKKSLGCHWRE